MDSAMGALLPLIRLSQASVTLTFTDGTIGS